MATHIEINHNSGPPLSNHYDTTSGTAITVTSAGGLNSSAYGLEFDPTAAAGSNGKKGTSAPASNELRFRFRCKSNLANFPGSGAGPSDYLWRVFLQDTSGSDHVIMIELAWDSSSRLVWSATVFFQDDGDSSATTIVGDTVIDQNEHCFEVKVNRESSGIANDGFMEIFLDTVSQYSSSTQHNFNQFGNLNQITIRASSGTAAAGFTGASYLDEIIIDDDSDASLGCTAITNTFRLLGLAADDGILMASGLKDEATLTLYDYDLATLTESGTAEFGAATDTELDNRTRGIFPVAKSMESEVWYLYGRDGNNVQLQYNDRNGTLGWTDIGPGTATWGTAKYAVGVLTDPTRADDVVVVFSDDDVYRTRFGTVTWVKMGDAGGGLRAGARHIANRYNELLAGGTAAGTVEWSNNFGVSFGDVSGTALGTINAIEVSL